MFEAIVCQLIWAFLIIIFLSTSDNEAARNQITSGEVPHSYFES